MESKGLKVTLENGVLKVTKGSLVVMKGIKTGTYLKGSTITCALTESVVSDVNVT